MKYTLWYSHPLQFWPLESGLALWLTLDQYSAAWVKLHDHQCYLTQDSTSTYGLEEASHEYKYPTTQRPPDLRKPESVLWNATWRVKCSATPAIQPKAPDWGVKNTILHIAQLSSNDSKPRLFLTVPTGKTTSHNHLAEFSQLTESWEVIWSYCCKPPNLQVFNLCSNRKLQNTTSKNGSIFKHSFFCKHFIHAWRVGLGFHPTHSPTKHVSLPFLKNVSCSF